MGQIISWAYYICNGTVTHLVCFEDKRVKSKEAVIIFYFHDI